MYVHTYIPVLVCMCLQSLDILPPLSSSISIFRVVFVQEKVHKETVAACECVEAGACSRRWAGAEPPRPEMGCLGVGWPESGADEQRRASRVRTELPCGHLRTNAGQIDGK